MIKILNRLFDVIYFIYFLLYLMISVIKHLHLMLSISYVKKHFYIRQDLTKMNNSMGCNFFSVKNLNTYLTFLYYHNYTINN